MCRTGKHDNITATEHENLTMAVIFSASVRVLMHSWIKSKKCTSVCVALVNPALRFFTQALSPLHAA